MSREFKCQCPLVTPAALTGNGCADVNAGTSMGITQTARRNFFTAILRRISSSQYPKPKSQIPNPKPQRAPSEERSNSPGRERLAGGRERMKYLCLIYDEETTLATMPKSQLDALMAEYRSFGGRIRKSGHYVDGSERA